MQCHWHQHLDYVMQMASSMVPFHLLDQDSLHEEQNNIFGDVMHLALALASHAVDCSVNGNIVFVS